MNATEYAESRKISNRLAKLIRQGRASEAQIAEYEERDAQERKTHPLPLRMVPHGNGEATWYMG